MFVTKKKHKKLLNEVNELKQKLDNLYTWQCNFYKDIPDDFPLVMTNNEKNLFVDYIKKAKNYLEFGSGGSTFLAVLNSDCIINSVESDKKWIDYITSYQCIRNAVLERLHFEYVNIGEVGAWGIPLDLSLDFTAYSSSIYQKVKPDLVFVDGRFRVACILNSILNVDKLTPILVHDYPERTEYHIVEKYLLKVELVDTLCVFKIKEDIDRDELLLDYNKYKNVVD